MSRAPSSSQTPDPSFAPSLRPAARQSGRADPWLLLLTVLLLCGGHGLLLALGLYKGGFAEYPQRLGGRIGMAAVTWLVLSGPLAALALALRARLQRSRLIWPLALAATAICSASFAYYLATIVVSRR